MKHSESEVTLTRPALYSIYDKDVTNTVEDYKVLKQKFINVSYIFSCHVVFCFGWV